MPEIGTDRPLDPHSVGVYRLGHVNNIQSWGDHGSPITWRSNQTCTHGRTRDGKSDVIESKSRQDRVELVRKAINKLAPGAGTVGMSAPIRLANYRQSYGAAV